MIESNDQSGLCHDNIAFHAACGFPWRDSFVLDPNVHCIKYLRTLEASRNIGVDSKLDVHGFWPHSYRRKCSHKGQPSLFNFLFLSLIIFTDCSQNLKKIATTLFQSPKTTQRLSAVRYGCGECHIFGKEQCHVFSHGAESMNNLDRI